MGGERGGGGGGGGEEVASVGSRTRKQVGNKEVNGVVFAATKLQHTVSLVKIERQAQRKTAKESFIANGGEGRSKKNNTKERCV